MVSTVSGTPPHENAALIFAFVLPRFGCDMLFGTCTHESRGIEMRYACLWSAVMCIRMIVSVRQPLRSVVDVSVFARESLPSSRMFSDPSDGFAGRGEGIVENASMCWNFALMCET